MSFVPSVRESALENLFAGVGNPDRKDCVMSWPSRITLISSTSLSASMVIGTGEVLRHTNVDVEFEAGEMRRVGACMGGNDVVNPWLSLDCTLCLPSTLMAFTSKT